MAEELSLRLPLTEESAVGAARRATRSLALRCGLSQTATEALATAVSEVARNAVVHAAGGELLLFIERAPNQLGVVAIVRDQGPGIPNVEEAMQDGYSTGEGLGFGLPGARRLVDSFALESRVPDGTTVTLKKWVRSTQGR